MNTPSEPVLTPTQRVQAEISDSNQWSEESPNPAVAASFALQMAGDLERAQTDLANEKSISSLNAKAGLELDKQLAVAQARIKELENWKSQMLQVWSEIDSQKIAGLLGATAGEKCFSFINRRVPEVLEQLRQSESGAAGLLSGRKVFVCKGCSGIYADEPVTACDCTVGKDQPGFEEGVIVMNSTPAGKSMAAEGKRKKGG